MKTSSLVLTLALLLAPSFAQAATSGANEIGGGGPANGGIELGSNGRQILATTGFRYDPTTNTFSAAGWRYRPRTSPAETYDLFQAIRTTDEISLDVSPTGNATAAGLPAASKVLHRMIVADILLGDITKGFGYLTPLYKLPENYIPVPYVTRPGSQRFVEYYIFTPIRFAIVNGALTAPGQAMNGVIEPVKVAPDGSRTVDTAAQAAGAENPAIKQNMAHVLSHADYYGHERVVSEMFDYAETAEFARVLKDNGIDLESIWPRKP